MSEERPEPSEAEAAPDDNDWDRRILCSDGNCIGVIGPDGRCKECGKPYEGELPERESRNSEASATLPPADEPEEKSVAKMRRSRVKRMMAPTIHPPMIVTGIGASFAVTATALG